MRGFILLFFGVAFATFGQQVSANPKNRLSFQLMQNTPFVGVAYKHLLWQGQTKPLRLETGLGLGWSPTFLTIPRINKTSPSFSLSHDLLLIYEKRPVAIQKPVVIHLFIFDF